MIALQRRKGILGFIDNAISKILWRAIDIGGHLPGLLLLFSGTLLVFVFLFPFHALDVKGISLLCLYYIKRRRLLSFNPTEGDR